MLVAGESTNCTELRRCGRGIAPPELGAICVNNATNIPVLPDLKKADQRYQHSGLLDGKKG
jgi:hypothetical protein